MQGMRCQARPCSLSRGPRGEPHPQACTIARSLFAANPEPHRARSRAYARTDRGREVNRRAVAKWRENNPAVAAAHLAFRKALRAGEIVKPDVCQAAGCECSTGLHGHHPGYDRPLLVVWLCRKHHEHVHHGGPLLLKPGGPRKVAKAPKKIASPQIALALSA